MARNYFEVNTATFSFFHFNLYFFGSKPTKDSKRFVETFPLPEGGEDWVSVGEIEYEIGNIVV